MDSRGLGELIKLPFSANSQSVVWRTAEFVSEKQLKNKVLWKLFVEQFRKHPDAENGGWRGEYWGKMMRGGCFVWRITKDAELYAALKDTVVDLLDSAEPDGRISSYPRDNEFIKWDIWCRKYVLLGLEYFYEICIDEALKHRIIKAACAHMTYIMQRVGSGEGKTDILETSAVWGAVNSCSILEPTVKLYLLTGEKKYLDYASYIIGTGGTNLGNLFELALKGEIPPFKYPVAKAYEVISFFEGLGEYYRATGEEKYLRAVLNFTDAVLKTDFTIIGGCGCTHELFDNSSCVQADETVGVMQETCVAVTVSKLLFKAYCFTGRPEYADAIETSYYNDILGSVNFAGNDRLDLDPVFKGDYSWSADFVKEIGGFTFDSYSPLYKSSRNRKTGGYQKMEGGTAYGCCACIGSAGTAVLPLSAVMLTKDGKSIVVGQYTGGKFEYLLPTGDKIAITEKTDYPYGEAVKITFVIPKRCEVEKIFLRVPSYSNANITFGNSTFLAQSGSFFEISLKFAESDENGIKTLSVKIMFDLTAKVSMLGSKAAVKKGCIVMAADCRNADINCVVSGNIVSDNPAVFDFPARLSRDIIFDNGTAVRLTDYASAGSDWVAAERKITAWFDT